MIKNVIYDCTADEQVLNLTEIDLFETKMFLFLIYEKLPEISDAKVGRKKKYHQFTTPKCRVICLTILVFLGI